MINTIKVHMVPIRHKVLCIMLKKHTFLKYLRYIMQKETLKFALFAWRSEVKTINASKYRYIFCDKV